MQASVEPAQPKLLLRLIVLRKATETTVAARNKLRREAPRKQKKLDPRSLIAARFLILATSLPVGRYPAEEVLAAYRLRYGLNWRSSD